MNEQLPGLEDQVDESFRNAVKAGLFTALWPAIVSVGSAGMAWLVDVMAWLTATVDGSAGAFPAPRLLVLAIAGLVLSVAGGILGGVVRWAQARGHFPGQPPSYPPSGSGGAT